MKQIKVILLLNILLGVQLLQAQETTLYNYRIIIDDEFDAELKDFAEFVDDSRSLFKGQNPLANGIIDETYDKIDHKLATSTKVDLLPVSTLQHTKGKRVRYTSRGYPVTSKRRAISHKTSTHYATITVNVSARTTGKRKVELNNYQSERKKIKPFVRIDMKIVDSNGKKVARYKGKAKAKNKILIQTRMLMRWFKIGDDARFHDYENQYILNNLINEAIEDLVKDIN